MTISVSMTAPIAYFISFELSGIGRALCGPFAIFRPPSAISMLRIETVVHMSMEVCGSVKPGTNANEGAMMKPFRAIVSIRSAPIRGIVKVSVGTGWSHSDANVDLGPCFWNSCHNCN